MKVLLALIISYLLGSIPTGYIIGKKMGGIDIRRHGSGNIGFTNVLRVMGIGPAAIVLIVDMAKGAAGTITGYYLVGANGALLAGIAAMLGNIFPVFLQFKGGKMVATGAGVMFALVYRETFIALIVFLLLLAIFRYVSLSSISAAVTIPIAMIIFHERTSYLIFSLFVAAFIIIRHKDNIKRLLNGTESKIGHKAI